MPLPQPFSTPAPSDRQSKKRKPVDAAGGPQPGAGSSNQKRDHASPNPRPIRTKSAMDLACIRVITQVR